MKRLVGSYIKNGISQIDFFYHISNTLSIITNIWRIIIIFLFILLILKGRLRKLIY